MRILTFLAWLIVFLLMVFIAWFNPLRAQSITLQVSDGQQVQTDPQGMYRFVRDAPWIGSIAIIPPAGYSCMPPTQPVNTGLNPIVILPAFTCDAAAPLPPIDTQPPTVIITSPAQIPHAVTVFTVRATDNVSVTGVLWTWDGATIGTVNIPPFSLAWNAAKVKGNGWHSLKASAYDAAGNIGAVSLQVRVR